MLFQMKDICIIILYMILLSTSVVCFTVNNGMADFSDESNTKTTVAAYNSNIKTVNTSSFEHLTQLTVLSFWINDLVEIPDLSPIGDTLQKLHFDDNPALSSTGNINLAVLYQLLFLNIRNTNLSVVTTTCPRNRIQKYTVRAANSPLNICHCHMTWLKVSNNDKLLRT